MGSVADQAGGGSRANGKADTSSRRWLVVVAGVVLAGLFVFSYQLQALWAVWHTDALRSIGMLIPPVSLWLMWRAWSWPDWQRGGNWWGLALLLVAMSLGLLAPHIHASLSLWSDAGARLNLLPIALPVVLYVSGVVIFLGGTTTWRKAWFPICLLLFLQPVPGAFQSLVDLPMQYIAAHTARGFAGLIDVPVSQGLLKIMFAPDLGMYIAPGCNGLRGAVAMGYLALVVGYVYRMPWARWALFVLGAVALAYLFNLLRLCALVVYYWFAMRFPTIGAYGVEVDYVIGGCLFFGAAAFVFGVARQWRRA